MRSAFKPYGLDHPTWDHPTNFHYDTAEEAEAAAIRTYGPDSGHVAIGPIAEYKDRAEIAEADAEYARKGWAKEVEWRMDVESQRDRWRARGGRAERERDQAVADNTELLAEIARIMRERDDARTQVAKVRELVKPAWRTNHGLNYADLVEAYAAGRNDFIDQIRATIGEEPTDEPT